MARSLLWLAAQNIVFPVSQFCGDKLGFSLRLLQISLLSAHGLHLGGGCRKTQIGRIRLPAIALGDAENVVNPIAAFNCDYGRWRSRYRWGGELAGFRCLHLPAVHPNRPQRAAKNPQQCVKPLTHKRVKVVEAAGVEPASLANLPAATTCLVRREFSSERLAA